MKQPMSLDDTQRAIDLVIEERRSQIVDHGFTAAHDDDHADGELAVAAACYAVEGNNLGVDVTMAVGEAKEGEQYPRCIPCFPWEPRWDKRLEHSRRKRLVIAAALLLAEIERDLR